MICIFPKISPAAICPLLQRRKISKSRKESFDKWFGKIPYAGTVKMGGWRTMYRLFSRFRRALSGILGEAAWRFSGEQTYRIRKCLNSFVRGKCGNTDQQALRELYQLRESTLSMYPERSHGVCNEFWGTFLFSLVREFKPQRCLELGTAIGISAAFLLKALQLNGNGCLWTLDISEDALGIARDVFRQLDTDRVHLICGYDKVLLPKVVGTMRCIDFALFDSSHTFDSVLMQFNSVIRAMSTDSMIAIDDIHTNAGMKKAWFMLSRQPEVTFSLDLGRYGLLVVGGLGSHTRGRFSTSLAMKLASILGTWKPR